MSKPVFKSSEEDQDLRLLPAKKKKTLNDGNDLFFFSVSKPVL